MLAYYFCSFVVLMCEIEKKMHAMFFKLSTFGQRMCLIFYLCSSEIKKKTYPSSLILCLKSQCRLLQKFSDSLMRLFKGQYLHGAAFYLVYSLLCMVGTALFLSTATSSRQKSFPSSMFGVVFMFRVDRIGHH